MVDEDAIRRFDAVVRESLSKFLATQEPTFSARVQFSSNLEEKRDQFNEFIMGSTDIDEPEAVSLEWSVFEILEDGSPHTASVSIELVTEMRLASQEVGLHQVNQASIAIQIAGSQNAWVREAFQRISLLIESKSLKGVYRPLWVFRSQFFNGVVAQTVGFIGMNLYSRFTKDDERNSVADLIVEITNESDLGRKVDLLTAHLLDPTQEPWYDIIFMIDSGGLVFGALWASLGWLLPKLAPPSTLAFGSSAEKLKRRFGLYNVIVFGLFGSAIVIPLLQSFVF